MLFELIEEQTKTVMLANVREEYILKTIDRAVVEESRAKPSRVLIVFIGGLIGLGASIVFILIKFVRTLAK
jgi:LPS O-antigen subunit length determinant protein (WzzB/FepE family)